MDMSGVEWLSWFLLGVAFGAVFKRMYDELRWW